MVAEQRAEPGAAEDLAIGPEDRLVERPGIAVWVRVDPQQDEAVEGAGPADGLRHRAADRVARAHVTERQAGGGSPIGLRFRYEASLSSTVRID